jgi:hypothetical protein
MAVSKNEASTILALLGLSSGVQMFGQEGGFIAPETLTKIVETIPLPYLVIGGIIVYFLYPKVRKNKTIVCSTCHAIIGHEVDGEEES